MLITPIRVLITLLTKSPDPPSSIWAHRVLGRVSVEFWGWKFERRLSVKASGAIGLLGFRVWGLGLRVQGLGFRVQGSGFGV